MAAKSKSKTTGSRSCLVRDAAQRLLIAAGCKVISEQIAADLFTNGEKKRAKRLIMKLHDGNNIGGWSERAVQDRIATILGNCASNGGSELPRPAKEA